MADILEGSKEVCGELETRDGSDSQQTATEVVGSPVSTENALLDSDCEASDSSNKTV